MSKTVINAHCCIHYLVIKKNQLRCRIFLPSFLIRSSGREQGYFKGRPGRSQEPGTT